MAVSNKRLKRVVCPHCNGGMYLHMGKRAVCPRCYGEGCVDLDLVPRVSRVESYVIRCDLYEMFRDRMNEKGKVIVGIKPTFVAGRMHDSFVIRVVSG